MATFKQPPVQPYNIFRQEGTGPIKSRYLPNDYYVEFTPSWWRLACDNAVLYSDLTFLDAMYGWCIQSSPFLVSQINKRTIPIAKAKFAFINEDGEVDEKITDLITGTNWWGKMIQARLLSNFYGVKMIEVDIENDLVIDFPMRNIDIVNKAIRSQTYGIETVALAKDYDNLFYMQPNTDQDFKLGMMQPISRAMIGINEAYINWSVTSASYSYPQTVIGYIDGNKEMKALAEGIAENFDPLSRPIVPFKQNLDDKSNVYQIEIKPIQTQMYPDAFRVFKEYIDSYRQEIMQLVTGGTLLGATEKNTNSEQLANIHVGLYEDICDNDKRDVLNYFNNGDVLSKLARLTGIESLQYMKVIEVPDRTISIDKAERIITAMSKVGVQPNISFWEKIGLEKSDINIDIMNNNWHDVNIKRERDVADIQKVIADTMRK